MHSAPSSIPTSVSTSDLQSDRDALVSLLATLSFRLGEFTLSSGARSDYYIDCRTTTLHAEGGRLSGIVLLDLIRRHAMTPDAVGGLTMGADPLVSNVATASAIAHRSDPGGVAHPRLPGAQD